MQLNEDLSVIYSNEIRSMIIRLLEIYEELSLPQISKIMKKNKTTIQYHLQILKEANIIITSRESQKDSRGSIATKYYTLKTEGRDYHIYLDDFKEIKDTQERLTMYKEFILQLDAGIKDLVNRISLAEKGVQKSLKKIEELSKDKITMEELDKLHDFIKRINLGFSTISVPKAVYIQKTRELIEFFKTISNSTEEYFKEEKKNLQNQNYSEAKIKEFMKTSPKYIMGHEIIAIMLPLKEIIDTLV